MTVPNPGIVGVITKFVHAYTRGRGFDHELPNDELGAVITAASARMAANPEQIPHTVGSVSFAGGYQGWNLAEQAVLNRYRVRAR